MFVKRSLSAEDFCSIKQISNPQVHPLGNFIAFSITEPHYHENRYITHLFVIDKNMEIRQLTSEGTNNYNPVWSPNGDEIVFISNISGLTGLWKTKLTSDTLIPLRGISEGLSSPIWSPDAKRIMFLSVVSQAERSESDVIVINRLPFKFDGAGFLKDNWRHLFVIDTEGGAPEPVTTGEYNVLTA
ncbi:MAG: hypothetical protein NTY03_04670, partial [Candidatus Bathyarchaeota archaeon]|nr:hypothetical protein [Candidatus Bathyarchaeota archaeon]